MGARWKEAWRPRPLSTVSEVLAAHARCDVDPRYSLTQAQIVELEIAHRMAFARMLAGDATEQNWATVVCSLNIGLMLAESGFGCEYVEQFNDAIAGAFRAQRRSVKSGVYGFDGPAIQAIQDAFDIHEQQIRIASKDDLRAAISEVHRRADAGHVFKDAA